MRRDRLVGRDMGHRDMGHRHPHDWDYPDRDHGYRKRPRDPSPPQHGRKRLRTGLISDDEGPGRRWREPPPGARKPEPGPVELLEDQLDRISNAYDVCAMLPSLEKAAMTDTRFDADTKASFFMSLLRKANTYYCHVLCEPILEFIEKYLTFHNIRNIDFGVAKFLDNVQACPTTDTMKATFRKILEGRRNTQVKIHFVTHCPECGLGTVQRKKKPARQTASAQNSTSVDVDDDVVENGAADDAGPSVPGPEQVRRDEKEALLREQLQGLMQDVDTRPSPSFQQEKQKVLSLFEENRGDDDVEATGMQVALNCPLSFHRINVPSKGLHCRHVQCFDLESFLHTQLSRKRHKKKEQQEEEAKKKVEWPCPVCKRHLRKTDLYVDKYFLDILNKADSSWKTMEIHPDASVTHIGDSNKKSQEVIVIDDEAPDEDFDWSVFGPVKLEEEEQDNIPDSEVDWSALFHSDVEKWLRKRHPKCYQKLIGVTKEELLLTPRPLLSLLFPELGLGTKLSQDLAEYRSRDITEALEDAAPFHMRMNSDRRTRKEARAKQTTAPTPPTTPAPPTETAPPPPPPPSEDGRPGSPSGEGATAEGTAAGPNRRGNRSKKKKKGREDFSNPPPPTPAPAPAMPMMAPMMAQPGYPMMGYPASMMGYAMPGMYPVGAAPMGAAMYRPGMVPGVPMQMAPQPMPGMMPGYAVPGGVPVYPAVRPGTGYQPPTLPPGSLAAPPASTPPPVVVVPGRGPPVQSPPAQ